MVRVPPAILPIQWTVIISALVSARPRPTYYLRNSAGGKNLERRFTRMNTDFNDHYSSYYVKRMAYTFTHQNPCRPPKIHIPFS
jgi:hypothetical protein